MKRFVMVMVLVGLLATALAGVAMAAPPTQGTTGSGNGIHTPGTGLMQPGTGYGAGAGMRRGAPEWAGGPDDVAAILGMKAEDIQAQRLAGQSLAQIAQTNKGMDEKVLVEKLLAARKADLDKLVAAGKLSQTQADYMNSHMQTQITTMVERSTTGPAWQGTQQGQGTAPMGGRMGRGGMGRINQ